jgi:hypothetical protein
MRGYRMATRSARLTHSLPQPAFSDSGAPEPYCEFPYSEVDAMDAMEELQSQLDAATERGIAAGKKIFEQLVNWIWQDGMKDERGVQIRAMIVCWVFLPHLHPLNLTELARGFGKDKQSLGRWVDDFKVQFPKIRNKHMK